MSAKVNSKVNSKYKDRLFCLLFGSMEYKENIISLYNALNGTDYDADDIEQLTTIEDVIYIKMKNDVSLLIDGNMTLWEQQSSYNPNMPVRGFMYFASLYESYIELNGKNIYGSSLVRIPTPKYVVLYNGTKDTKPVMKLRLSDAFINPDTSGEFEWTATMYNINKGKNDSLLDKCRPLAEYMELINRIRKNQGELAKDAVDAAVQSCIKDGILQDFLVKHRAEVIDVCLTEFNEERFVNDIKTEGMAQGYAKAIFSLVQRGIISIDQGAQELETDTDTFVRMMEEAGYKVPASV